uniref:PRKR-interacting protein 1 n=1 Tax=Petromyzon marinus TaxID=7757 RepID=A0AAJ7UIF7_PETMA|nr:PRKR-interacting protein 1 [Petromyzon marinus]
MKNPDKPVNIPEGPRSWAPKAPPEFVRDVMGSSAGAGSGEFHVYRHIRRREYVRQEYHERQASKTKQDEDFVKKLQHNKLKGEKQTARKTLKRWKLKQKKLAAKVAKVGDNAPTHPSAASSSSSSGAESAEDDAEEPSFVMGAR